MSLFTIICIVLLILLTIYGVVYAWLRRDMQDAERSIVDIFLAKVSKIPAVIEVMRPYVIDGQGAFSRITDLHSESMIHRYDTIYMLLEQNARIHDQYGFLMRLSMAIPELQKHAYFIYIRDFVISYETMMRQKFARFNQAVHRWNRFVQIKNMTLIGYILPGSRQMEI